MVVVHKTGLSRSEDSWDGSFKVKSVCVEEIGVPLRRLGFSLVLVSGVN